MRTHHHPAWLHPQLGIRCRECKSLGPGVDLFFGGAESTQQIVEVVVLRVTGRWLTRHCIDRHQPIYIATRADTRANKVGLAPFEFEPAPDRCRLEERERENQSKTSEMRSERNALRGEGWGGSSPFPREDTSWRPQCQHIQTAHSDWWQLGGPDGRWGESPTSASLILARHLAFVPQNLWMSIFYWWVTYPVSEGPVHGR